MLWGGVWLRRVDSAVSLMLYGNWKAKFQIIFDLGWIVDLVMGNVLRELLNGIPFDFADSFGRGAVFSLIQKRLLNHLPQ